MSDTTTIFTFAQFAFIGVFAVVVIFGMLFGMRLKRRRLAAGAEVEEHREAAEDAPVAVEPEPQPPVMDSPAPVAPTVIATPALTADITRLKGLGPKLAATLAQLGITRVEQIAAMSPAQLADLDAQLGTFKGRPARDRWADQARLLVAGDTAAYEAEFGKLG